LNDLVPVVAVGKRRIVQTPAALREGKNGCTDRKAVYPNLPNKKK
jgi:hypothetical protein